MSISCSPLPIGSGALSRRESASTVIEYGTRTVLVGGGAPIVIQSMTNTDTVDAIGTAIQVKELVEFINDPSDIH
ncbi:MAG: hypothetical protein V4805_16195, partial [Pseudomonadota bacterium]